MPYDARRDPQHVPGIALFNPGTGPVEGATVRRAKGNVRALLHDAGLAGARVTRAPDRDEEGRYGFDVRPVNRLAHEVEMPGLPLSEVRYVKAAGQSIWDYPRLYLDGNSWVWFYAVEVLREHAAEARDGVVA